MNKILYYGKVVFSDGSHIVAWGGCRGFPTKEMAIKEAKEKASVYLKYKSNLYAEKIILVEKVINITEIETIQLNRRNNDDFMWRVYFRW